MRVKHTDADEIQGEREEATTFVPKYAQPSRGALIYYVTLLRTLTSSLMLPWFMTFNSMVAQLLTSRQPRSLTTVQVRGIGTGISEASKRVPIFLHDVRRGKQVSSYFGQELRQTKENWDQALGSWQGSDPAATIVA